MLIRILGTNPKEFHILRRIQYPGIGWEMDMVPTKESVGKIPRFIHESTVSNSSILINSLHPIILNN
jgi:hypothetical protein